MKTKMTNEEYKKNIQELKETSGVKRVSVPIMTEEEEEKELSKWFKKGTVLKNLGGTTRVVK